MLVLNGSSQYAHWDGHASPVEGQGNQNELGGVCGFPLWIALDFKSASSSQNTFLCELSEQFGLNRYAIQFVFGTVQVNDGITGKSPSSASLNVWNRLLAYKPTRASTTLYLNGVTSGTDTGDSPWGAMNSFILGGRLESSSPADLFYNGNLANVAIGSAILTPTQCAACLVGTNPLALPGVVRNWPLKTDALDTMGAWPLTLGGSPTITATGHPDVTPYHPTGGGGGSVHSRQLQRARL